MPITQLKAPAKDPTPAEKATPFSHVGKRLHQLFTTPGRFTLNNWPPLASHAAFLLLGAASANLMLPTDISGPRLSKQKLVFSLSRNERQLTERPTAGSKLWPVKSEADKSSCTLSAVPMTVLDAQSDLLLSLDMNAADVLPAILAAEKKEQLRLVDDLMGSSLSRCKKQRTVRYATSN